MWQKALDLLDEMKTNGINPNSVTYSVAISACGNGGQWEKALDLLNLVGLSICYYLLFMYPSKVMLFTNNPTHLICHCNLFIFNFCLCF